MPETKTTRITPEEIARDLGIGLRAVRKLLDDGEIPSVRLGRRRIVTRHVYERWVQTCGQGRVA